MCIIEVQHLKKTIGKIQILRDINICVRNGDIYGLFGPNGAGKTSTIRSILGIYKPTQGKISIFGKPINRNLLRKIGVVLEYDALPLNWRVIDVFKYVCSIYDISYDDIKNIFKTVGIYYPDKKISTLSKGMRRRVSIGLALIHDPDILILDEPISGLDPQSRRNILGIIKKLNEEGKTILLSSHDLKDVQSLVTRFGIIFDGITYLELDNKPPFLITKSPPQNSGVRVYGTDIFVIPLGHNSKSIENYSTEELLFRDIESLYFYLAGMQDEI